MKNVIMQLLVSLLMSIVINILKNHGKRELVKSKIEGG